MAKKLLMFDFDGTLVDSKEIAFKSYNAIAPDFGLAKRKNSAEFSKFYNHNFYSSLVEAGLPAEKVQKFNLKLRDTFVELGYDAKYFPGIKKVIEKLSESNAIIIITSNITSTIQELIKKSGLSFMPEVLGGDIETSKVKKIALARAKYPNLEAIYIGDTLGDIIESRKAGVRMVAVTWGYHSLAVLKKGKPDFIARKPEDLLKIIGA